MKELMGPGIKSLSATRDSEAHKDSSMGVHGCAVYVYVCVCVCMFVLMYIHVCVYISGVCVDVSSSAILTLE